MDGLSSLQSGPLGSVPVRNGLPGPDRARYPVSSACRNGRHDAWLTDSLVNRVFVALSGKGIEPARIPKATTRKPLARLLSLPLPDETERIPSTARPATPNAAFRIQAGPC